MENTPKNWKINSSDRVAEVLDPVRHRIILAHWFGIESCPVNDDSATPEAAE